MDQQLTKTAIISIDKAFDFIDDKMYEIKNDLDYEHYNELGDYLYAINDLLNQIIINYIALNQIIKGELNG